MVMKFNGLAVRTFLQNTGLVNGGEAKVKIKNDPKCDSIKIFGELEVRFVNESVKNVVCSSEVAWFHDKNEELPDEVVCFDFTSYFKIGETEDILLEKGIHATREGITRCPEGWKVCEFH